MRPQAEPGRGARSKSCRTRPGRGQGLVLNNLVEWGVIMSGCCSLYSGDYDEPSCFRSVFRKARKTHTCVECREPIVPGQVYEEASGKWEGSWDLIRTCVPCVNMRNDLCWGGFIYGGLREQISECLGVDPYSNEAEQ